MKPNKTLSTAVALALSAWSLTAQDNPQQPPKREPGAPERPPGTPREGAQQHEGGPRREEPRREVQRPMPDLFNALDANHDGVIDATELAQAAEVLRRLDRNGDGKITPDEFRNIGEQPREGEGRRPQIRDGEAGRSKQPDGARRETHPSPPAQGQSRGPDQGREFAQRGHQQTPQFARDFGQHRDSNASGHPNPGNLPQGQPGSRNQGPGFDRGGHQPNPQIAHHHEHRGSAPADHRNFQPPNFAQRGQGPDAPHMRDPRNAGQQPDPQFAQRREQRRQAFAQRGGPRQPGGFEPPRMAQNNRGPGPDQAGPRPQQHDGPQVRNFNGPRSLWMAPQFWEMRRQFRMMGRPQNPGAQPGAPWPQQGFHGPPNPQNAAPHPMGSNPPGTQGREGERQHHEHQPQHQPQQEGARTPGPPPPNL